MSTKLEKVSKKVSIYGLVNAVSWDEDGNVEGVAIMTGEEEEYNVGDNALARELLKLEYEEVWAVGAVRENACGEMVLFLDEYEVLDTPLRSDEDDEELYY